MGGVVDGDDGAVGEDDLVGADVVAGPSVAGGEEGDSTLMGSVWPKDQWEMGGRWSIPPNVNPPTPISATRPPMTMRSC